ncbi:UDP-galactose transporter [Clonorchis sinensis]|uniref:UDP-galactose transporter n=1 Tax=Clonorchis sinensis TaxID=79923 RepID=G7YHT3_CLOSI|nr:UDP-galactose transporter [Clonorchis sinensis]
MAGRLLLLLPGKRLSETLRIVANHISRHSPFKVKCSDSEVSGKIDAYAVAPSNCETETTVSNGKIAGDNRKRTKTVCKARSASLRKLSHATRSKSRGSSRRHRQSVSAEPQAYKSKHHSESISTGSAFLSGKNFTPPEREQSRPVDLVAEDEKVQRSRLETRFTLESNGKIPPGSPRTLASLRQRFSGLNSKAAIRSRLLSSPTSEAGICVQRCTIKHAQAFVVDPTEEHLVNLTSLSPKQNGILFGPQLSSQTKASSLSLSALQQRPSGSDLEEEVKLLRWRLASQSIEAEKVAAELASVRRVERAIRSELIDLNHSGSVKADTVSNLTSKIAELYADIESLRCAHSHAIDHQTDLQAEVSSLKRSRDWYSEQLRAKQSAHDRTEADLNRLRGLLKENNDVNHRLTHENACLRAQVACTTAALADAKRNISQQLESIRVDMIEREVIFERVANKRAGLEKINVRRSDEVNDLQTEVLHLKNELSATDEQVARQRARLEQLEESLSCAETRRSELQEMLQAVEHQQQLQECQLSEKMAELADALIRINSLETECERQTGLLLSATEERDAALLALEAACRERDTLNAYLGTLKASMTKIEESFDKLKYELQAKSNQLSELTEQKSQLYAQLEAAQAQLEDAYRLIMQLKTEEVSAGTAFKRLMAGSGQDNTRPDTSLADAAVQTSEYHSGVNTGLQVNHATTPAGGQSDSTHMDTNSIRFRGHSEPPAVIHLGSLDRCYEVQTSGDTTTKFVASSGNCDFSSQPTHAVTSVLHLEHHSSESLDPCTKGMSQTNDATVGRTVDVPGDGTVGRGSLSVPTVDYSDQTESLEPLRTGVLQDDFTDSTVGGISASAVDPTTPASFGILFPTSTDLKQPTTYGGAVAAELRSAELELLDVAEHKAVLSHSSITGTEQIDLSVSSHSTVNASNIVVSQDYLSFQTERPCVVDALSSENYANGFSIPGDTTAPHKVDVVDYIHRLEEDQMTLRKALLASQRDNEEALSKLAAALREVELHSGIVESEAAARQKAVEAHQAANTELQNATFRLRELEAEVETLRREVTRLRTEIQQHQEDQESLSLARTDELSSLRAIVNRGYPRKRLLVFGPRNLRLAIVTLILRWTTVVQSLNNSSLWEKKINVQLCFPLQIQIKVVMVLQTITKHMSTMSQELKQAQHEKIRYQTEYARLRGGVRAQVERFRLFTRLEPTTRTKLRIGESAQSVLDSLSTLGIDIESLEDLLGDSAAVPLLRSKPIEGLEKCFENLQTEIDQLENDVVENVCAVQDSVKNWRQLNVLHQAASCSSCYDIRDIALHVYTNALLIRLLKILCGLSKNFQQPYE